MISTIDVFTGLSSEAARYAKTLYSYLMPQCAETAHVLSVLWITLCGYEVIMGRKRSLQSFMTQFYWIVMIEVCLVSYSHYWEWIYQPLYEAGCNLTQGVVSQTTPMSGGIREMLQTIDGEMQKIFTMTQIIRDNVGKLNINFSYLIYGWFLNIPFLVIWLLFLSHVLGFIFKLMAVSAVMPLLLMMCVFKSMRQYLFKSFSLMMHGTLTMVFGGIAMGFTLFIIKNFLGDIIADPISHERDFWSFFLVSCLAGYFHWEAPKLAASILGAHEHHGGAAAFAALATAPLAMAGRALVGRVLGPVGQIMTKTLPANIIKGAQSVYQASKNTPEYLGSGYRQMKNAPDSFKQGSQQAWQTMKSAPGRLWQGSQNFKSRFEAAARTPKPPQGDR